MADYTPTELSAAVEKLVRTSIRREYGGLGTRRTDITFSDTQDAAAGVFTLYQNAPFYVLKLGRDRVQELVDTEKALIDDFLEAVVDVGRTVTPVSNLAPLANARSALQALSSATAERITPLARVEDSAAYNRFESNTTRFLRDSSKNIRSSGAIVRTPQESKSLLAGYVSSLKSQHEALLQRVGYLTGGIDEFNSMNLPATLSASIIANAQSVLAEHYDTLADLTDAQRLARMREVTLDVLAARAVVRGFGALPPLTTFVVMEGFGSPYADADHPATPASLASDKYGPYIIVEGGNQLYFQVDSSENINVQVPGSYSAQVASQLVETYDVDTGGDYLYIFSEADSGSWFYGVNVTLSHGSAQSAQDIADDINGAVTTEPIFAEPYNQRVKFSGPVYIKNPSGANADFEKAVDPPATTGDWGDLTYQPEAGDYFYVDSSVEPSNTGWWVINNVTGLPTSFNADRVAGGTVVEEIAPLTAPSLELGQDARGVLIRFTDAVIRDSIEERAKLRVSGNACATLGYAESAVFTSQPTPVADVVRALNDSFSIAPVGTARMRADVGYTANVYDGTIRTVPTNPLKVVASVAEGTGDLITNSGIHRFNNLSFAASEATIYRTVLVARGSTQEGVVDTWGIVVGVGADYLDVDWQGPDIPALETGMQLELGWHLRSGSQPAIKHIVMVIEDDGLNDGTYLECEAEPLIPSCELTLTRPLPVPYDLGSQPLRHTGSMGQQRAVFASTSVLADSAIEMQSGDDDAYDEFFNPATPLPSAVGSTRFFQTPEEPKQVEPDDLLELYDTNAITASYICTIDNVEVDDSLVRVEEGSELDLDLGSFDLDPDNGIPLARIRKGRLNNFTEFADQANDWVELPVNETVAYFRELNRLVNVLAVNANPTPGQINTVVGTLQSLSNTLDQLEPILAIYEADTVEQVDALLAAYKEKGSDRASDILLEGRFRDFFNLSQDEVSYAGAVQAGVKEVMRADLPVRRYDRPRDGYIVAEYEEKDFEYDWSDAEDDYEDVSAPAEDVVFPRSAF